MAREVLAEIREHFKEKAFTTVIHNAVVLREAASLGKPITQYSRSCVAYEDYDSLANEVIMDEEKYEGMAFGVCKEEPTIGRAFDDLFSPHVENGGVTFVFRGGEAGNVQIVGEFNDWTPEDCALYKANGESEWRKEFDLAPGSYEYQFIIDGRWEPDPNNPFRIEGLYGGFNSIVEVR